jgi:hypothetical protein
MEGFEYDGEWKDDRKEGRGKMKYVDGSVYEGIWKDDKVWLKYVSFTYK